MALVAAEVYELSGPGRLELKKETLNTQDMACDEIIAKTIVTVVSPGTEVAAFSGAAPLRPMKAYPRLIGYCNVAEVTHVGSSVTSVKPGDRVSTHQSHRSAFRCKVDEINAILEGDDDPVRHASLYLWHLGYYPLLRAGIQAGHNVGVVGLGTLGLCAVSMARLAGCNVYAVSDQVGSLRTALDFGASKSYSKSEAGRNTTVFTDFTDDVGLDCVVSTSNSWEDWELCLKIVRDGGCIAVLGFPGRSLKPPPFNPLASKYIYDKELTIFACGNPPKSNCAPRELRFTLKRNYAYLSNMIRLGRLPTNSIVSDVVGWRMLGDVYKRMNNREDGLLTVALEW